MPREFWSSTLKLLVGAGSATGSCWSTGSRSRSSSPRISLVIPGAYGGDTICGVICHACGHSPRGSPTASVAAKLQKRIDPVAERTNTGCGSRLSSPWCNDLFAASITMCPKSTSDWDMAASLDRYEKSAVEGVRESATASPVAMYGKSDALEFVRATKAAAAAPKCGGTICMGLSPICMPLVRGCVDGTPWNGRCAGDCGGCGGAGAGGGKCEVAGDG